MMVQNMNWDVNSFLAALAKVPGRDLQNRLLVERFEQEVGTVAKLYFSPDKTRLFDRTVFYFNDINAEALAGQLYKKFGLSKTLGSEKLATTNMCHWSGTGLFSGWWEPAPSVEALRGLLVISAELLQIKDFAKEVISSYEEIKREQSWDV
jgi:hypothetical protein